MPRRRRSGFRISEERLLALVQQIYEVALEPALWPNLLKTLTETFDSHAGFLFLEDHSKSPGRVVGSCTGIDPELIAQYNQHYAAINPFKARSPAAYNQAPGFVINSSRLCSESELKKSEYYAGFLKPADIAYSAGGTIYRSGSAAGVYSINRSDRAGPYVDEERVLQLIGPHLAQAFRIYQALGIAAANSSALDALPFGVVILSMQLRPIFMNARARTIIDKRDGLRFDGTTITAGSRTENYKFQQLSSIAAQCAEGKTLAAGDCMSVSRPSGEAPLQVLVSPIRLPHALMISDWPAVLVVVSGGSEAPLDASIISKLFGLTRKEAALTAALIHGASLAKAADELHIAYETARSHLAKVFQKTGTHRQSELTKLVIGGITRAGFSTVQFGTPQRAP